VGLLVDVVERVLLELGVDVIQHGLSTLLGGGPVRLPPRLTRVPGPRKCKMCFRQLPAIEFYSCPRKSNGLYTNCKLCVIIDAKDCHPPLDRTHEARTNEDAWCQKCHMKLPAHNFNDTCNDCLPVYERTVLDTRCTKCDTTKPASEFSTENRAKNGIYKSAVRRRGPPQRLRGKAAQVDPRMTPA